MVWQNRRFLQRNQSILIEHPKIIAILPQASAGLYHWQALAKTGWETAKLFVWFHDLAGGSERVPAFQFAFSQRYIKWYFNSIHHCWMPSLRQNTGIICDQDKADIRNKMKEFPMGNLSLPQKRSSTVIFLWWSWCLVQQINPKQNDMFSFLG